MKSKDLANGKNHVGKTSVEEIAANQVKPADIIWVKNHGGSWWPAQVVDENLVSESSKPSKRSAKKVLVRLYGTYTYSYVDPIKCHSEFDEILKQNNNSYRDIFLKALEKDVTRLKSSKSKKQRSKSKVTKDASNKASKRGEGKDEVKKKSGSQSKSRGGDEGEGKSRKRKIEQDGMQKKRGRGDAVFLGSYRTTLNYPLVCGPYRVPFLLNLPGSGNDRVIGELYGVTAAGLARLDILEGTSRGHYQRLPITVEEYSCDIIGNDEDADDEDEDEDDEDDGGVKRRTRRAEAYYAHSSYALKLWNKDGRKGFASYTTEVARGYVSRKDRPQHLTFLGHIHSFLHDHQQQQQQGNNLLL